MIRRAVLIDELDRRLGTVDVPDATFVIRHDGRFFIRNPHRVVRLRPNDRATLPIFEETEVYNRERLTPI